MNTHRVSEKESLKNIYKLKTYSVVKKTQQESIRENQEKFV